MKESITIDLAGRPLTITTGELAKQADGSVIVQHGDTVVLVTAVAQKEESKNDFPSYRELSGNGIRDRKVSRRFFQAGRETFRLGSTYVTVDRQTAEALVSQRFQKRSAGYRDGPFRRPGE